MYGGITVICARKAIHIESKWRSEGCNYLNCIVIYLISTAKHMQVEVKVISRCWKVMSTKLISLLLLVLISSSCSSHEEQQNPSSDTVTPFPTGVFTEAPLLAPSPTLTTNLSSTVVGASINPAPTMTLTPTPDFWMDLPVVPTGISDRVREIYQRGLSMGNDPHAFSKVGDCHSTNPYFLADYDLGPDVYHLGDYAYLQPTIDYFAGSFSRASLAAKKGLSTAGVLASLWSDWKYCTSNETPLDCEFRLHHPSFAIVSLGTNEAYDVKQDHSTFEPRLRRIIEHSIDQGVVPILSTKADNDEGDYHINYVMARLAMEYELPLWNFWKAVQPLPQKGMRSSDHLTFAPTKSYTDFSDPTYLEYGMQIRNLTALQVLDVIRREIVQSQTAIAVIEPVTPTNASIGAHLAGETMISSIDGMTMIYIPAGEFTMGSTDGNPDETPVHSVQLDGYWLDRTEVTNSMFANFLNTRGNQMEGGTTWLNTRDPFVWVFEKDGVWQTFPGRENYPIVGVSWYGANAYCQWAGHRLPTEAEWEYAAKGVDNRRFPWGDDYLDCNHARYSGCGNTPVEVGSLSLGVSPFGVFDLAGNVAEWLNDRYAADYYQQSPRLNPTGPINRYYRVIRGGYWGNTYIQLQTSHRDWAGADQRDASVGFRCALTP
jgi:formylglycine-generating enzyme required for sulfatase activity